jgi:hypothetical protein
MKEIDHALFRSLSPKPLADHIQDHKRTSVLLEGAFVKEFGEFIEAFRNSAAHGKAMTIDDAQKCRDLLFATPESLFRVLCT